MKARWYLVGVALAAVMAACATDVGTVDRTQHDKLEKKLFAGIWYMNQTVIDIPYNAAFSFVGEMNFGATGKVLFDIQKDDLIVYPVTEYVEGSEKKWHQEKIFKYWDDACLTRDSEKYQCVDGVDNLNVPGKTCCFIQTYVGQPVARFAIKSHFDVKRKYNPATGEQTNLLEENATDKLWWQRGWMRVDFSKNLVNDFTFMARMVDQTPADYYVQTFESGNPDAPTLTSDYIDVVTKVYGVPQSSGACDIYGVSYGDCAPALVKFRTAFRKVDPAQDYEPMRFHNEDRQKLFGYFLTERNAYDENWGVNDAGSVSFINRWNLWDHSFTEQDVQPAKPCFKDLANTGCDTTNRDGTKEFCKADDWFQAGRCVIRTPMPYTQRGLRPIQYHVSANLPEDLWAGSLRTANVWSEAFKQTVAWLYLWEEKGLIVGQTTTRNCTTDADCTSDAILVDTQVELDDVVKDEAGRLDKTKWPKTLFSPKKPVACTSDATCGSGQICAPANDGNYCHNVLWQSMAKTVVALPGGASVTTADWGYPEGMTTKCGLRLLNLVEGKTVNVTARGNLALSGIGPVSGDVLDPAVPVHTLIEPTTGSDVVKFEITEGDSVLASTEAACVANSIVTLVLTADKLLAASAEKGALRGVRIINATGVTVDVSVDGGLRQIDLRDGQNTGYGLMKGGANGKYLPPDFLPQRLVVTKAGSRGDLTCYRTDQYSKCVGYNARVTDEDWKRYEDIKAQLPEMFVMCRNTYTKAQGDQLNDDAWKSRRYAAWDVIHDKSDSDLAAMGDAAPEWNPCVDFQFAADKMDPVGRLAQAESMKKIGDSRYSMIYWVAEAQMASPLGYGPTAADPDSGQIFWGIANIYGAPMYTTAAFYRDLFDLVNGKLDTRDYVTGKTIRDYVANQKAGSITSNLVQAPVESVKLDASKAAGVQIDPATLTGLKGHPISHGEIFSTVRDKVLGQDMVKGLPALDPTAGKKRLGAVKGTIFEKMLESDEIKLAAEGQAPEMASPLDFATLEDIQKKERERQIFLSSHNYCFADGGFNDEGMIGMARMWACIGDNAQKPRCDEKNFDVLDHQNDTNPKCCIDDSGFLAKVIHQRFYVAVVEHEVGHTMGLRHNFEGSSDLFNFQDEYYDIRDKEPIPCKIDYECEGVLGQTCVNGYCTLQPVAGACKGASDCGFKMSDGTVMYQDHFDCIGGQCVELTRCGIHGECPDGSLCNGNDHLCYQDGKKLSTPVTAPADPVVREMIPRENLSEAEQLKSRTMYQYSTIMDYGQRWHSDVMDLGKYDYAAIRFGYGGLREVYTDTRHLFKTLHQYAQAYGYDTDVQASDNINSDGWNWGIYFSQLYFLNHYIGVDANRAGPVGPGVSPDAPFHRNRAVVPHDWVKLQQDMTSNYFRVDMDWAYIPVPYKFCGDEYSGNVGCYTWDTGMDPLEIVYNMKIELKDYYLLDAFKRERFGFGLYGNPLSYLSRIQSRWMEPMRGSGMYYALFSHILKNYPWRGIWANGRMMGWALRRASELGFETLADVMTSPAPGSFKLDAASQMYRNVSFDEGKGDLDVPLSLGKYPYTTFMDDAGYFYWQHALFIGSFWEKLAALMTLTDSTVYFTTNYVGEQLNIGVGTSIGFNTLYPRQLTEIMGGIVANDAGMYAWPVVDGRVQARQFIDPTNSGAYVVVTDAAGNPVLGPDGKPKLDAAAQPPYLTEAAQPTGPLVESSIENLTFKLYMMLYGMAYLPASFDPSYLDSFTVCLKGNGNCHEIAGSAPVTFDEFDDPFGGKTYQVWGPAYQKDWYSPNVALVQKANVLKAAWEAATGPDKDSKELDLRKAIETLDLMRGIYEIFNQMKI